MKFNYYAFRSMYLHEMDRFKRTLMQSLFSPVLSTSLYFIVFGSVIGGYVEKIDGISYGSFIVPGLLMLTLLTQSISNTSFGIFFPKFNGTIYEILAAPISTFEIVLAFVGAGATKTLIVGLVIFLTSTFFVEVQVMYPLLMIFLLVLVAFTFALFGFLIGLMSSNFEQMSIIPTLVITPMVFLGDIFTLNIYGREIDGEVVNFREVDYRDLSINFAMLFNPQFAQNIPHEYLATAKFNSDKFDETEMLEVMPSLSMIKIADYLTKVTAVLNKVFIAVTLISAVTIVIGLIVISSAIMVQGKVKEYQNLVFKILGFSKKEIILSSLIEFIIIFKSVILIAIFFAIIGSKFIMENIFELVWMFDFKVLIYLGFSIGFVTLLLIMLTNLKYLNPKVYPLIRNQ